MKLSKETRNNLAIGDVLHATGGCHLKVTNLIKDGRKIYITVQCVAGPSWMISRKIYLMGISNYYGYEIIKNMEV